MNIETHAYARAGLLGNPSDGYFGKTISIIVKNFSARISLQETDDLKIEPLDSREGIFESMDSLVKRVKLYGYYGGARLIKAAIVKFHDYCRDNDIRLEKKNFTIRYGSSIPRQVGLGGSSALVTAALRALSQFYGVQIPLDTLPSIALDAEAGELDINAGLQDRVIQAYEGCLYMDFNRQAMTRNNRGVYEPLDPESLPPLFVAYKSGLGKVSGHALSDVRAGFDRGDERVIGAFNRIASLAERGKEALLQRNYDLLFRMMNENFDLRSAIMKISEGNRELVETARACGASAKFAGSGGSIIGMWSGDDMWARLTRALNAVQAEVIKPMVLERH